jgi:peptidyl-prolyl cis-trans isomerase A (cyclophilin A)
MGSADADGGRVKPTAILLAVLACCVAPALHAQTADKPAPGYIRVKLITAKGIIILALDQRRAPRTTANFLTYVDDGRLDGTVFFRASRRKTDAKFGFVEGGIGTDARRTLAPIALEPTSKTGLHHIDGAISMARSTPDSATGNFSILVGPALSLDARPGNPGYAVFGRVISGMEAVKAIMAEPTGGGWGVMKGQMILKPVLIQRAIRLDGTPKPSGGPKIWLINIAR